MTEYEKMISGELYDATDNELMILRRKARKLITQINNSLEEISKGKRLALCHRLFGKVQQGLCLQPPFYCDYGKNIEIGEKVFFNFNCIILDVAKVLIGSHVLIGPNVQICTATHPLNFFDRQLGKEFGKSITIQDHVWIGAGAILCPGITIGEKSIVGAGSIVIKDIPAGVIVAGNPARILKKIV